MTPQMAIPPLTHACPSLLTWFEGYSLFCDTLAQPSAFTLTLTVYSQMQRKTFNNYQNH
jgi:hypothetical protein